MASKKPQFTGLSLSLPVAFPSLMLGISSLLTYEKKNVKRMLVCKLSKSPTGEPSRLDAD